MKRDAIAFAVDHDRAEAVRPDRMDRFDDAASLRRDLCTCVANASVDVHVDEDARGRADRLLAGNQTSAVALGVIDHAERVTLELLAVHLYAKHGPVVGLRAVEVLHWDVKPNDAIVARVEVAHLPSSTNLFRGWQYGRTHAAPRRCAANIMRSVIQ